jgi:hypothetical protein
MGNFSLGLLSRTTSIRQLPLPIARHRRASLSFATSMPSVRSLLLLAIPAMLSAQQEPATPSAAADPLAPATDLLRAALKKSAQLTDTAFTFQWGPNVDGLDPNIAALLGGRATVKATGCWHPDRLQVTFEGENGDEIVCVGRDQIARARTSDWRLRRARFADGNVIKFVPDPPVTLRVLATLDLVATRRVAGELGARAVEIVTADVRSEWLRDLCWSGAMPAMTTDWVMLASVVAMAQQPRAPATMPRADVTLALWIDPATRLVQQLHVRTRVHEDRDVDCLIGAPPPPAAAPATGFDEKGLPIYARQMNAPVADFTLRLTEHGAKQATPLTDDQKKLLGR